MNTTVTITDTITDTTATCAAEDIAETLAAWYEYAPAEIGEAVQELEDAVCRGDETSGLEALLSVTVRRV